MEGEEEKEKEEKKKATKTKTGLTEIIKLVCYFVTETISVLFERKVFAYICTYNH